MNSMESDSPKRIERSNDENTERTEVITWLNDLINPAEIEECVRWGASKEGAIVKELTSGLHRPGATEEEVRRVEDLRNSLVMIAYPNFTLEEQDFYRQITGSLPGATDVEVTDRLRGDLATLLHHYDIELPTASAADPSYAETLRALLPPLEE